MPAELAKIETPIDPKENRRANELEYVLRHLRLARDEVLARPRQFAADALEKIDKAIALMQESWRAQAEIR